MPIFEQKFPRFHIIGMIAATIAGWFPGISNPGDIFDTEKKLQEIQDSGRFLPQHVKEITMKPCQVYRPILMPEEIFRHRSR
jgi:hypothetical protein